MSSQTFKVIKFEVLRQIKKPSFWIAILAGPVMIAGIFALNFFNSQSLNESLKGDTQKNADTTIGIFDESQYLKNTLENLNQENSLTKVKTFSDTENGLRSLKNNEISTFFHIPKDFDKSFSIKTYTQADGKLLSNAKGQDYIKGLLYGTASFNVTPVQIAILNNKYSFTREFINTKTGQSENPFGKMVVPIAILIVFYVLITVFGNRMFMSIAEEKETRISEMLLTAIPAKNLIIGKIISTMIVGLISITCLIVPALSGLIIFRENPMLKSILGSIEFNPFIITTNIILLILSFFFITCVGIATSALTATAREASQYSGMVIMGVMIPFFFLGAITAETASVATYAISIFPLSAPIALMMRNALGALPTVELFAGLGMLSIYSIIACFIAIKNFEKHALTFTLVKPNFLPRKIWSKKP